MSSPSASARGSPFPRSSLRRPRASSSLRGRLPCAAPSRARSRPSWSRPTPTPTPPSSLPPRSRAAAIALSARPPHFDVLAAVRALKRTPGTAALVVVAFDVPTRPQATALEQAGAARAVVAGQAGDLLPGALAALLAPAE